MSNARPLPTVIGPAENSLRALLSRVLASTRIKTYPAWVILNATSRADANTPDGHWRLTAADQLKIGRGELDDVLAQLVAAGLVDKNGVPTALGAAELAAGRSAVADTTRRLVEGISEEEQAVALSVLDRVRVRADELLRM